MIGSDAEIHVFHGITNYGITRIIFVPCFRLTITNYISYHIVVHNIWQCCQAQPQLFNYYDYNLYKYFSVVAGHGQAIVRKYLHWQRLFSKWIYFTLKHNHLYTTGCLKKLFPLCDLSIYGLFPFLVWVPLMIFH